MQRIVLGIALFVLSSSPAEARRRPWEDEKKDAITLAAILPVTVMDPNARAEAETQHAIDEAFLTLDLATFSDSPGTMANKPDPALLVAWRGKPPKADEREPDKVYLSAPAAPTK